MSVKNLSVMAGEPTWDIAQLFPRQGEWSVQEYLALPTNRLIEFTDGHLKVLPMPTNMHQNILLFLYHALFAFVSQRNWGKVLIAGIPVRLSKNQYREPDIVFMLTKHLHRIHEQYWDTPDLVMEVVSPGNRENDIDKKRKEYAQAGIPEYWIVDPMMWQITVLKLKGKQYTVHGVFGDGEIAQSALLKGFMVNVADVWNSVAGPTMNDQ